MKKLVGPVLLLGAFLLSALSANAINPVADIKNPGQIQNRFAEKYASDLKSLPNSQSENPTTNEAIREADVTQIKDALQLDELNRENTIAESLRQENLSDRIKGHEDLELAMEVKNVNLHLGKSLTDMHGNRVRMEEYVLRPTLNQVQFLNLTMRDQRLDYINYLATFNTSVPKNTAGIWSKCGPHTPAVFLTNEEISYSNLTDSVIYQIGYFQPAWDGLIQKYVLPEKQASLSINTIRKVWFSRSTALDTITWYGFATFKPVESSFINGNLLATRIQYTFADGTYLRIDDYLIGETGDIRQIRRDHFTDDLTYWINNFGALVFNSYKEKIITASEFENRTIDTVSQFQHLVDVFDDKNKQGWR